MRSMAFNPAKVYSSDLTLTKEKNKQLADKIDHEAINKVDHSKTNQEIIKNIEKKAKEIPEAARVEISEKALELKRELSSAEKTNLIQSKKIGNIEKPGIYFMSGFDWFGAGSIKGNYDGIKDMSEAIKGAKHFAWDEQDEIIEDIKKRKQDQPIVLVGHSFGGDGVVEIAQKLNTLDNGFRKIDLMVTLDSVGMENDLIPQNVVKNLNYLAQGPYNFLNDGPNLAINYERTEVKNYLRPEAHSELDDATDIQMTILEEVEKLISPKDPNLSN